jgi:hypothetical protein
LLFGCAAVRSLPGVAASSHRVSDADGDQVFGDLDVVPGESDDILDLLPADEDENRCSTVPLG